MSTEDDIKEEADLFRSFLVNLTDEQRVRFFDAVERGFCRACGRMVGVEELRPCQCENDE